MHLQQIKKYTWLTQLLNLLDGVLRFTYHACKENIKWQVIHLISFVSLWSKSMIEENPTLRPRKTGQHISLLHCLSLHALLPSQTRNKVWHSDSCSWKAAAENSFRQLRFTSSCVSLCPWAGLTSTCCPLLCSLQVCGPSLGKQSVLH